MTHNRLSKTLFFLAAALVVNGGWSAANSSDSWEAKPDTRWSRDCTPNYASTMLPPSDERGSKAELVAEWSHWPLQVAVLDDGKFATSERIEAIRTACRSWESATMGVPEGRVSFVVSTSRKPMGADVVVAFCRTEDIGGLKGLTHERKGWIQVKIACDGPKSEAASIRQVVRCTIHEFGHVLGVWGHSTNPRDAMSLNEEPCEISIADVNTLRLAYRPR